MTTPRSYWVVPGRLLGGEYPGSPDEPRARARIHSLVAGEGVTLFLDLTREGENGSRPYADLVEAASRGWGTRVRYHRFPVPDYEAPDSRQMVRILDRIDAAIIAGEVVYVHCYLGIGRTGTVAGCYLVRQGQGGADALASLDRRRRRVAGGSRLAPSAAQRAMVLGWRAGR